MKAKPSKTGSFKVWCHVTGGVTGTRMAFLKVNGVEVVFHTREAAEAEVTKLVEMTRDVKTGAKFFYEVMGA